MTEQSKTDVPSTTSEPGYAGIQVQQQPSHGGDDLLNGGSGETESPTDPPNQGASPDADPDLLQGGSGKPG